MRPAASRWHFSPGTLPAFATCREDFGNRRRLAVRPAQGPL